VHSYFSHHTPRREYAHRIVDALTSCVVHFSYSYPSPYRYLFTTDLQSASSLTIYPFLLLLS
jgi:hypothetical protein